MCRYPSGVLRFAFFEFTNDEGARNALPGHGTTVQNCDYTKTIPLFDLCSLVASIDANYLFEYTIATNQEMENWNKICDYHNEVACLMLDSMTPKLQRQFENYSPYDMLQELKSMFEKQTGVESIGLILNGLPDDFVGFVRNYNMQNMGKTIGGLHVLLIEYEKGLRKKDDACHHCKEMGHWKRNCHVCLADLMKKKKHAGSAISRKAVKLKEVQDEDTSPSENTNENLVEAEGFEPPQEDVAPIRSLEDLNEPANYKAALLDPKSNKWLDAMNAEMQSTKDNQVWRLIDLPPNGKTVGSKWHFKKVLHV
ncbi:putative retrotransposon ty1-copia subclass protein [Tanacetum coccineum]|uniref:Retrotransposon ty1-copia subclass protein n=1 Tax=Tanacetum coccineum TaxID=301880 RepID=A0ABQ5J9Y5_9ASTR